MGKAIARKGDMGDGACTHIPRRNDEGSPNVFVNGIPIHRVGDHWPIHCNPVGVCHDSVLTKGSSTVFANGKAVGRIGDLQSCGAHVAEGSPNVFSG